jgi:hypothetical protein
MYPSFPSPFRLARVPVAMNKRYIHKYMDSFLHLYYQLSRIHAQISLLIARRCELRTCKNALTPICRLPEDVLIFAADIFLQSPWPCDMIPKSNVFSPPLQERPGLEWPKYWGKISSICSDVRHVGARTPLRVCGADRMRDLRAGAAAGEPGQAFWHGAAACTGDQPSSVWSERVQWWSQQSTESVGAHDWGHFSSGTSMRSAAHREVSRQYPACSQQRRVVVHNARFSRWSRWFGAIAESL